LCLGFWWCHVPGSGDYLPFIFAILIFLSPFCPFGQSGGVFSGVNRHSNK
jgi:hypothetical protein